MIRDRLNAIRMPEKLTRGKGAAYATALFVLGIFMGAFSKWLDNLALDSSVWWHRWIEAMDLGNFFSDIAIWLLLGLLIAVFSKSPWRAALNVFLFFAGMCAAYHVCSIVLGGFNPSSYMLIWYGITALSPLPAVLCWYAGGTGPVSILLDIGIIAVFALSCFATGFFYMDLKGILYLPVFCGALASLYRNGRQFWISLPAGILLALLASPIWPFQ